MKRWMSNCLIVIFALVFAGSSFLVGRYFWNSRKSQNQYDELAQIMEKTRPAVSRPIPQPEKTEDQTVPEEQTPPEQTEPVPELVSVTNPKTGLPVQILPEFSELYVRNSDLVGWLEIPDTNIYYPVVQTPDHADYYLYRDFDGKDSNHGCIYVREVCDVLRPSDNVVIYGHRMKDGSMFNNLLNYDEKSYYESHKYIYFDTLQQRHTYEIFAAFKTVATSSGFDYHMFVDAADQADFDEFVTKCKEMSFYDTGVSAQYGDKLITLSTCEYTQDNGRMVIVAKQIG